MLKTFRKSLCAGLLISVGGCAYLSCESKPVGAVLFSTALLCICFLDYYLFTGKVGYLTESHTKSDFLHLLVGLAGNLLCAFAVGVLMRALLPQAAVKAEDLFRQKLSQTWYATFGLGVFCGIMVYLAGEIYRRNKTPLGVLFCIPVFVLCGFEHSVADLFYWGISGTFCPEAVPFLLLVIAGNTVGGLLLPLLAPGAGEKTS